MDSLLHRAAHRPAYWILDTGHWIVDCGSRFRLGCLGNRAKEDDDDVLTSAGHYCVDDLSLSTACRRALLGLELVVWIELVGEDALAFPMEPPVVFGLGYAAVYCRTVVQLSSTDMSQSRRNDEPVCEPEPIRGQTR